MKRFKILVYAQQFLSEAMPIYVFYAIMFADQGGLSTAKISLLFVWWGVVGLVSELPTGVIADKYSRKYSIVFGGVLRALGFLSWMFFPFFEGYALGFLLWGVGGAFNSGAFEAYLYDELKSRGKPGLYAKMYGRSQSMVLAGQAAAYVVAAIVGSQNYSLLIILSVIVALASAALALRFPKEAVHGLHPEETVKPQYLRTALRHVRRSPLLARYVLSLGVIAGVLAAAEEFAPLYYVAFSLDNQFIAILYTVDISLAAIVAWYAHRFEAKKQRYRLIMFGLAGAALAITSFAGTAFAVLGMVVFMQIAGLVMLQYETVMQHEISDTVRATTSSLSSVLAEMAALIMIGGYGLVASLGGDIVSMRTVGIIALLTALLLALYWRTLRSGGQSRLTSV